MSKRATTTTALAGGLPAWVASQLAARAPQQPATQPSPGRYPCECGAVHADPFSLVWCMQSHRAPGWVLAELRRRAGAL